MRSAPVVRLFARYYRDNDVTPPIDHHTAFEQHGWLINKHTPTPTEEGDGTADE